MQRGFFKKGGTRRQRSATTAQVSHAANDKDAPTDGKKSMPESSSSTRKITDHRQHSEFQFSDVCRLYSNSPRIIVADHRLPSSHFIFLPSPENATMVFIDSLERVQAVSAWHLWNDPAPSPAVDPPFLIRESGNKGLGMFATRPIARGEVIVAERPILVSHPRLSVHPDQKHAFHESALAGLSAGAQTAISTLRNAHQETPDVGRIRGILLTNALAAQIPHDSTHTHYSALFAQLCRANHDCAPNAHYSFSAETFTGRLSALRAIDAEEEITIGYTDVAAPRAARRQSLAEKYIFECHCTTCDLAPARGIVSDTRRAEIGAYFVRMEGASLARVKEMIASAEEEGLVEAACLLAVSGIRLAQSEKNDSEKLRFTIQGMNYIRALEGNDSASFVAFARRMGMGTEQLAMIFDNSAREGVDYRLFERLLAANSTAA